MPGLERSDSGAREHFDRRIAQSGGCPSGQRATLSAMEATTGSTEAGIERFERQERLADELATLTAHLNAATCRWLELVWALGDEGVAAGDELARYLAFRCGITTRESREHVRVAEALRELPATRESFSRGELTFTKVRALTRVATPASEEGLLELAGALTASQLERALRAFRHLQVEEARESHELEYVDYHFAEDGSLYLRARLAAEEGTLVVKALEAARERVVARRREEERAAGADPAFDAPRAFEPSRSAHVEALVELAELVLVSSEECSRERPRLVVHIDAHALTTDAPGRCELADGPVLPSETARRLGCDAETVTTIERDGLPLGVGRARRSVPPRVRRVLEARDDHTCQWPGCERRRHLDAHHRVHWAHGGETSLENLVLLCWHHHRLVHEGGYTIEDSSSRGLGFRNRHGVLCPSEPPRPPPGSAAELVEQHVRLGLVIDATTNRAGDGDPLDLDLAVGATRRALAV